MLIIHSIGADYGSIANLGNFLSTPISSHNLQPVGLDSDNNEKAAKIVGVIMIIIQILLRLFLRRVGL